MYICRSHCFQNVSSYIEYAAISVGQLIDSVTQQKKTCSLGISVGRLQACQFAKVVGQWEF